MNHWNVDIRVMSASMHEANGLMGLGMTVVPHVPVSGKGSRAKHDCACGRPIGTCGQMQLRQGRDSFRFNAWYSIHGAASCVVCWDEIYDAMMELE